MRKLNFKDFLKLLKRKLVENELLLVSYALTYKLLMSLFPLMIFMITIIGFLDIDLTDYLEEISRTLPQSINETIQSFLLEITETKAFSLLSFSFAVTIYSASSGFNCIIIGLNKAYDLHENRNFFAQRILSTMLVFIFTMLIIMSMILLIFGDYIRDLLVQYTKLTFFIYLFDSFAIEIIIFLILFVMLITIYKLSISRKLKFKDMLPGAVLTLFGWGIASKIFNIYVNNFSSYSMVYGTIGSIFILFIWINIIVFVLLVGGQVNAILESMKKSEETSISVED